MKKKKQNKETENSPVRLNKYLSMAGVVSRRKADELIEGRKVSVNDSVITRMGALISPGKDTVKVNGKEVKHVSNPLFILMNKPRKCVCTTSDPEGRTTVFDIIKTKTKLFSVGRLDFNTEGLLVITNDGETAQLIAHPTNKVKKVYKAKVRGVVNKNSIRKMTRGVVLEGVKYSFASIKLDRVTGMNSWVTITLLEGKNRQIHKVCEVTGHRLIKLKRVQFGKLLLGTLKPGEFRPLTPKEVTLLRTSPLKPIKKT